MSLAARQPASGTGLETYLSPGHVVIDVGANVGVLTKRYAGAVGRTGTVVACEPHPDTYENLRERCAAWPHVQVLNVALDAVAGTRTLVESKTKAECSLWAKNVPLPSGREHVVQ